MAAELRAEGERPLEIDAGPLFPKPERGAGGGFVGDIDLEHGAAVGAFLDAGHG
jgi:hypothetical protein